MPGLQTIEGNNLALVLFKPVGDQTHIFFIYLSDETG
jgi:hypothetical protein